MCESSSDVGKLSKSCTTIELVMVGGKAGINNRHTGLCLPGIPWHSEMKKQAIRKIKQWSTPCLLIFALLAGLSGAAQAALSIASATVNGAATTTVAPGASITVSYSVTVTGGNDEVEGTLWRISTTAPGTTTCANSAPDSPSNTNGTYTTGFTATAPATAGTYNLYLIANDADGCGGGTSSAVFTLSNAVIVAPALTIGNASVTEGNSGTANATFTVTLSAAIGSNVTFNYATSNGTATGGASCTAGVDYITASSSKTITAGATSTTIDVQVCGDTTYESDETFTLTLSGPSGASLGAPSAGTGTITNDDLPAPLAIYKLDDQTWDDSSGSAYHGSVGGFGGTAPTFANASPAVGTTVGTCGYRAFNRPDKTYIYLPAAFPNLGATGTAFTITAWIRTTDNTQSGQRILIDDEGIAGGAAGYGFSLGDGGTGMVRFFSRGTPSALILDTPNVIANNTWYLVAAVIDVPNKTKHIYVFNAAGTLLSHVQATWTEASFGSDSGVVSIGGETNASGENTGSFGFAGNIDEIRVYSSALSQADVALVRAITRTCPVDVVAPGLFNACEVTSPQCTPTTLPTVTYALLADKTAGVTFALDAVALLSGGTLNTACSGNVQVDLVANASAGVSLGSGNCPVSQTATIALGTKTFASGRAALTGITVGTAYADVRVKYTYAGGTCGSAATVCSTDNFAIGAAGPNHIRVFLNNNSSALTCTPRTVDAIACADSSCASRYGSTVSVTLNPGGTAATIPVSGTGTPSVAQTSAGSASVTLNTSVPATTGATAFRCYQGTVATPGTEITGACDLTFSNAGFFVSVPDHASCGTQTLTVTAAKTDDVTRKCVPAFDSGASRDIKLRFAYSNPASGTVVPTVGGASPPTSALATGSDLTLAMLFTGGIATTNFRYRDTGSLTVSASYTGSAGTGDTGLSMSTASNPAFVVAPGSFAISGIPAAPLTAGAAFNVTATAKNSCGDTTANFGQETPTAATAALTSSNPDPALGNATAISQTLSGFSSGVASTNLTWNEVGTFDLTATTTGYLGSAFNVTGSQAAVGRFKPGYFDTIVTQGCGAFTYAGLTGLLAGQPIFVQVKAKRSGGDGTDATNTANYAGATWARDVTLADAAAGTGGTLTNTSLLATAFASGTASRNDVTYTFTNKLTAPYTLAIRATDADTTPVSSSGHAEGSTEMRSGRLRLSNAFGSEKSNLAMPVQAHYWSGSSWVLNSADSCSSLLANAFFLSGAAAGTAASAVPITSGVGTLTLTKPTTPAPGNVDVAANLGASGNDQSCLGSHGGTAANLPWLRSQNGSCAATYDRDPSARATFGLYAPETRKNVHVREQF